LCLIALTKPTSESLVKLVQGKVGHIHCLTYVRNIMRSLTLFVIVTELFAVSILAGKLFVLSQGNIVFFMCAHYPGQNLIKVTALQKYSIHDNISKLYSYDRFNYTL